MNTFNSQPAGYQTHRETLEECLERVRSFQKACDPDKPGQHPPAPDMINAEIQNILPNLAKIGYLLNLIQERGTVLLPPNWQN